MVAKLQDKNLQLTLQDITDAEIPRATATYTPVPNRALVDMALAKFGDAGRVPSAMGFHMNKDATEMLGVVQFQPKEGENTETPFTALLRNSYNKKWSVGIAAGVSVFYCTNMMISGNSFKFFRKHTSGVWTGIQQLLDTVLVDAEERYRRQIMQQRKMRALGVDLDRGYELLGKMYGNDILKPRMFASAIQEWREPRFETFERRDMWSLYNAATWGVKAASPTHVVRHNPMVHDFLVDHIE